jgi:multiple sugar transport system permease protein
VAGRPTLTSNGLARRRPRSAAGYGFVSLYVVLLIGLGVLPTAYAIYLALTRNGTGGFAALSNFIETAEDFQFLPAVLHIAAYIGIWVGALVVFGVGLALLVHDQSRRRSAFFRFVYYLPGALTGAGSVLLWVFMLDPSVSPFGFLEHALGMSLLTGTTSSGHLPVIFTLMAFWAGAGGWILVLYGALNTISGEVLEAARTDGANRLQVALRIKLPLVKKWVVYMVVLVFAAGTQIFTEPTLLDSATSGTAGNTWSLSQLSYNYAFTLNNFNGAAAIALDLLALGLICAAIIVTRTRLFDVD